SMLRMTIAAFMMQALHAGAEIPDAYAPMPVEAPFAFSERTFDLTPALERARRRQAPIRLPRREELRLLQAIRGLPHAQPRRARPDLLEARRGRHPHVAHRARRVPAGRQAQVLV